MVRHIGHDRCLVAGYAHLFQLRDHVVLSANEFGVLEVRALMCVGSMAAFILC
jgi:hypothetical protein